MVIAVAIPPIPSAEACAGSAMTTSTCMSWSESGKSTVPSVVSALYDFCKVPANIVSDVCKNFCSKTAGVWCDDVAAEFCQANPSDINFCACYNFPSDVQTVRKVMEEENIGVWSPNCYVTDCAKNPLAYKSPAATTTCPELNICSKYTSGSTVAGTGDLQNINFSCESSNTPSISSSPSTLSSAPVISSSSSSSASGSNANGNIWVWVLASVAVAAILIVILMYIWRMIKGKKMGKGKR